MAGVGPQQRLGLVPGRVAEDHGLAAAEVEAGGGGLVGHGPGQAQHVLQALGLGRVGVEAGAAEGRPQAGGVDGDDGPQPGTPVVAEHDLLVVVAPDALEDVHRRQATAGVGEPAPYWTTSVATLWVSWSWQ